MLAPPERSKQMNGILPAPARAIPQLALSASRSGASAAWAARGLANRLNTVGANTLAAPATKPWDTNCRRVTGRGWSGWRTGASGCRAPRRDFLFIVASTSLQQRAGAADHGRAGRLDDDFRAVRGACTAAGREPHDQRVHFGLDFRADGCVASPVPIARATSGPVTCAGVTKADAAGAPKLKPGK